MDRLLCGHAPADGTSNGTRGMCYVHGWQPIVPETIFSPLMPDLKIEGNDPAPETKAGDIPPAPETLQPKTITVQCPHCQNLIEVIVDG